jgi:DNA polymerase-3 subunit gamma/tau
MEPETASEPVAAKPLATPSIDILLAAQSQLKATAESPENNVSSIDVSETPNQGEQNSIDVLETSTHQDNTSITKSAAVDRAPWAESPTRTTEPEPITESVAPLAQPETDPNKMGLNQQTEDRPKITLHDVDITQLSALLPNGEKLENAAQVDRWSNIISQLGLSGLVKQLAVQSAYSHQGSAVTLTLDEEYSHLLSDSSQQALHESLEKHFAMSIELVVEPGSPVNTPMLLQRRINEIRKAHVEAIFANDPNLQALTKTLNATVKDGTLKPKE